MKNRAMSNMEMVIAFTLFIGAVLFAIYFLSQNSYSYHPDLDQFQSSVISQISASVTTRTLFTDGTSNVLAIELKDIGGARVTNAQRQLLSSEKERDILYVQSGSEEIIYVNTGELYNLSYGGVSSKPSLSIGKYSWGSSSEENIVSEEKLLALNNTFSNSPDDIRTKLGLSMSEHFGIKIAFNETEFIKMQDAVSSGNVFTKTVRTEIVRKSGESVFADLTVELWQ